MPLPRLNIIKLCQNYRLEYAEPGQHHHAHSGWVQLHCPFCTGGVSGFHLGFSLSHGGFNCWRCGGHSAWNTVAALLKTKRSDLIHQAFAKSAAKGEIYRKQAEAARAASLAPPASLGPLRKAHRRYLRSRDFSPSALVDEWELQGTTHLGGINWGWRVVAPIHDADARIVAYVGRSIRASAAKRYQVTDDEKCLINPGEMIYGIHKVPDDTVVIVEGPTDVWRLGPGAVATMGTSWKKGQALQLTRFKRRFIMFDPERAAQRQARKLAAWLGLFSGSTEIITGLKSDPGDFSKGRAKRVMKELMGG